MLGFTHIFDVSQLTDDEKLDLFKANGGKKDGNNEEIFQGQQCVLGRGNADRPLLPEGTYQGYFLIEVSMEYDMATVEPCFVDNKGRKSRKVPDALPKRIQGAVSHFNGDEEEDDDEPHAGGKRSSGSEQPEAGPSKRFRAESSFTDHCHAQTVLAARPSNTHPPAPQDRLSRALEQVKLATEDIVQRLKDKVEQQQDCLHQIQDENIRLEATGRSLEDEMFRHQEKIDGLSAQIVRLEEENKQVNKLRAALADQAATHKRELDQARIQTNEQKRKAEEQVFKDMEAFLSKQRAAALGDIPALEDTAASETAEGSTKLGAFANTL